MIKSVLAFTVTAVVLILFLVVIQTSILKNGPSPKSHQVMLKLASSSGVVSPVKLILEKYCEEKSVIAIPISQDFNGIPLIDVYIGEPPQVISTALDTASCDLVVSGKDCSSCGSKLGKYNPTLSNSSEELDKCSNVTYGTQSDDGCWWSDEIGFVGKCVQSCSDLNSRSILDMVKFKEIKFMVSKERKESPYADGLPKSDYSVFGLCHSTDLPKPVMRQILENNEEINFTLVISKKQKWFILGRLPENCTVMYNLEHIFHPEFFVVKIASLCLGGAVLSLAPKKVIVDSGSNFMFVPHSLLAEIKSKKDFGKKSIEFEFSNFTLTIPPESYYQDRTLLIYGYENNDSIILGSLLLNNTAITFNIVKRTVSIGQFQN